MTEDGAPSPSPKVPEEVRIPVLQEIYDNPWFIFVLSLGIVLISYIIWGFVDLLSVPVLP